ncbi:MAG: MarR family transcriptional regulator [Ignavibacteria bacterium]|jgi:MarR family 2-MHQ and catechol resistance regulon transcriptional repressor|nr:MarR family transcriptional regulator [Ignavibacteria bacterium]MCU7504110.1 MarR family transcriptional regulator [Ignavibacteria bacterium]MCU7516440.1 MarR family transcriptional regulator [Ignavibacteria bacterium]
MMTDVRTKHAITIWEKLFHTYEKYRKMQVKTVFEHHLTGPQYSVLEVLFSAGPMPLKKIGERLYVSGANITCVVDNLEKEELVRRVPSSDDRRIIIAELTNKGREKIEKLFPLQAQNILKMTEALSHEEQDELMKLLNKLDTENKEE